MWFRNELSSLAEVSLYLASYTEDARAEILAYEMSPRIFRYFCLILTWIESIDKQTHCQSQIYFQTRSFIVQKDFAFYKAVIRHRHKNTCVWWRLNEKAEIPRRFWIMKCIVWKYNYIYIYIFFFFVCSRITTGCVTLRQ